MADHFNYYFSNHQNASEPSPLDTPEVTQTMAVEENGQGWTTANGTRSSRRRDRTSNRPVDPKPLIDDGSDGFIPDDEENDTGFKRRVPTKSNANSIDDVRYAKLREYYYGQFQITGTSPNEWINRPELPTPQEVLGECEPWQVKDAMGQVAMDANLKVGAFESVEHYLKTHAEFLREEGVAPLRDAVAWAKRSLGQPEKRKQGFGVYEPVKITGLTNSSMCFAVEVAFSTARCGVRVNWEQSSRLMTGSLVALSSDNFHKSCIVAIVAARDINKLSMNPPKIDLVFADPRTIEIDSRVEYVMVENRNGFFEAQRHTMLALKKMTQETFPFQNAFVKADLLFNNTPPDYIQENHVFDFSQTYGEGHRNISILEPLPKEFEDGAVMDKSQCDALKLMLTKPLAIVQGPPGTGKTFVSVVALRLLISRMSHDDPPIIVATQTNHALDQLLRHIALDVRGNFARLGGRSKDEGIIKQRAMHELRQKLKEDKKNERATDPKATKKRANNTRNTYFRAIEKLLESLSCGEPDIEIFVKEGILSQQQADSIVNEGKGWIGTTEDNPILKWLGRAKKEDTGLLSDEHLGFEYETILEEEVVDERNAETKLDEYIDMVRGRYVTLYQTWFGDGPQLETDEGEKLLAKKDLTKIPKGNRGSLYNYMLTKLHTKIRDKIRAYMPAYYDAVKEYKLGNFERDFGILIKQKLIGMTTTGLSKYRGLVHALQSKIVLIEEAAEVLEAPVAVASLPSVQQIILVGDHQQLKPQCQIRDFQGPGFLFDLSLFERLINNRFEYRMLSRQRRMIPEIRKLLIPIYGDNITDHEVVLRRDDVPGMGGLNSFLWKHDFVESKDAYASTENIEEARMIVGFYFYLLHSGVQRQHITIITFYNAQRRRLMRLLNEEAKNQSQYFKSDSEDKAIDFRVVTVDSYQGEENEVILLSLVRSNAKGDIGFVGVVNRVCVALSRARNGLYIFGNMDMIAYETATWKWVNRTMADPLFPRVDPKGFPIVCAKHKKKHYIEHPDNWYELDGGCSKPCKEAMPCGHLCKRSCHTYDHDAITCEQPCNKQLRCGHACSKQCFEGCFCIVCGLREVDIVMDVGDPDPIQDDGNEGTKRMIRAGLQSPRQRQIPKPGSAPKSPGSAKKGKGARGKDIIPSISNNFVAASDGNVGGIGNATGQERPVPQGSTKKKGETKGRMNRIPSQQGSPELKPKSPRAPKHMFKNRGRSNGNANNQDSTKPPIALKQAERNGYGNGRPEPQVGADNNSFISPEDYKKFIHKPKKAAKKVEGSGWSNEPSSIWAAGPERQIAAETKPAITRKDMEKLNEALNPRKGAKKTDNTAWPNQSPSSRARGPERQVAADTESFIADDDSQDLIQF